MGLGIAAGALTFYFADCWVDGLGGADRMDFDGAQAGGLGTGIILGFNIAVAVSLLQLQFGKMQQSNLLFR